MWNMTSRQIELALHVGGLGSRETPEQHQARLEGDRFRSRRQRTLETPDDRAGRLEADRMRVSRQRAVETPVHRETRLEAERSRSRRRREARIHVPTQAEDPETNYVISLRLPFNACIHLVFIIIMHVHAIHN